MKPLLQESDHLEELSHLLLTSAPALGKHQAHSGSKLQEKYRADGEVLKFKLNGLTSFTLGSRT